ncbi:tetratricopeptide (TPR) repeat protein [Sphingomonas zeicaulis]|uniref:tetratricopeptide repeat protein n=1 Tax=Sphingomonas zeicaulis TaxID=1632740 RepID=UPI003D1E596F
MDPYQMAMDRAEMLMRAGNSHAAIEPLRDALTIAPDQAYPHLLLARALRIGNRLAGARYEAERAIEHAPTWNATHLELAHVLLLEQRNKAALAATDHAIDLDPQEAYGHLVRAKLLRIAGRRAEAATSLDQALTLAPNSPDILAEMGYAALEQGRIEIVEDAARRILSLTPHHSEGLVLIGHVQLARGDTAEALRLALAALSQAPNDLDALSLLASTKMKGNPVGGLWWRWNRFLVKLGQARAIFLVVGLWVVFRWAVLAANDFGLPPETETVLTVLYLGFVIYMISASVIVSRMIQKEVQRVRLKPDF